MIKERFDKYVKLGIKKQGYDVVMIKALVDLLLQNLYIPTTSESCFVTDKTKLTFHGLDTEPINWGDLNCVEVVKHGDLYQITIDEASPECPNLCSYIEKYLSAWGWNVEVKTEW